MTFVLDKPGGMQPSTRKILQYIPRKLTVCSICNVTKCRTERKATSAYVCRPCTQQKIRSRLLGRVFGSYTVISEHRQEHKPLRYLCRCACGSHKLVYYQGLEKNNIQTCRNCYYKHLNDKWTITGRVFGSFTVTSKYSHKEGNASYHALCSCGKMEIVRRSNLIQGIHTACRSCREATK